MGAEPHSAYDADAESNSPRVLVTGGAGLLGTSVIDALQAEARSVAVLDDVSGGTHDRLRLLETDPTVRFHRVDLRNAAGVAAVCRQEHPSIVIHLAGRHFIPYCETHPDETWAVNVDGTRNLLAALAAHPPRSLLFASTADVYRPSATPHRESDPADPPTVYGRSKLAAERLLHGACSDWDTRVIIARLFNLYGSHHTVDHLIPTIVTQALVDELLHLGDLGTVRDFVYVDDAATAITGLLTAGAHGTYNIGTGIPTSGVDVVELVGKLLNRTLTVVRDRRRLRRHDRPVLVADPSKLCTAFGWWPATPLDQGLRTVIASGRQINEALACREDRR